MNTRLATMLLVICAPLAFGQPALVSHVATTAFGGTTSAINTIGANAYIGCGWNNHIPTSSDGATFTRLFDGSTTPFQLGSLFIAYAPTTGSSVTFTADSFFAVEAWSDIFQTLALDKISAANGLTAGAITPTNGREAIVACLAYAFASVAPTVTLTTPTLLDSFSAVNGGFYNGIASGEAVQGSGPASVNAIFTATGSPGSTALIASFYAISNPPVLAFQTSTLPNFYSTAAKSYPLPAVYGTLPITCTLQSGTLPGGFTLTNTDTNHIGCSPTYDGTAYPSGLSAVSVQFKATDSSTPTPQTALTSGSQIIIPTPPPTPVTVTVAGRSPLSPLPDVGACSTDNSTPCPALNGFVPFGSSDTWNTRIDSASLDPNSAIIMAASPAAGGHLHHDFGFGSSGYPYTVVDSSVTPLRPLSTYAVNGGPANPTTVNSDGVWEPIPLNVAIEGNGGSPGSGCPGTYVGDSHAPVIDRHTGLIYENYGIHLCGDGTFFTVFQTSVWDMENPIYPYGTTPPAGIRPYGWTGADASGSSFYAGLLKYDEVASGSVNHAIRVTFSQTANDANGGPWTNNATHPAGNAGPPWSMIMGMRIRLKAAFNISGYSAANQVILTAMKNYGFIVADNGGSWFFSGTPDSRWNNGDLGNLDGIASSNFEVVIPVLENPGIGYTVGAGTQNTFYGGNSNSGFPVAMPCGGAPPCTGFTAPTINTFSANHTTVASGSPVIFTYSTTGDTYDFLDCASPGTPNTGSITINPTQTTTCTLNSTNIYGRVTSSPITITVTDSSTTGGVLSGVFSGVQ